MSFIMTHLAIAASDFKPLQDKAGFAIHEVPATLSFFKPLIERVGGPWGWTQRPKYFGDDALTERLKDFRLFLLEKDGQTVGYCLSNPFKSLTLGFNGAAKVTEIENFGMFPEFNGKGFGKAHLPMMFEELFKSCDMVYLTTRSSNHAKVVKFYQDCGMKILQQDLMADDLVPVPTAPERMPMVA